MTVLAAVLVGLVVALNFVCAVGVLVMPDTLARLHFLGPASSLAPLLLAFALFVGEPDRQAGFKTLLLALILAAVGPIVSHQTARAHRIRDGYPYAALSADEERDA